MTRQDGTHFNARLSRPPLARARRRAFGVPARRAGRDRAQAASKPRRERARISRAGFSRDSPRPSRSLEGGRIVYANPTLRELFELPDDGVPGFALRDRIATSHVLLVQDALARSRRVGAARRSIRPWRFATPRVRRRARSGSSRGAHPRGTSRGPFRPARRHRRTPPRPHPRGERRCAPTRCSTPWDDAVLLVEEDASGGRVRLANRAFVSLFAFTRGQVAGRRGGRAAARCSTSAARKGRRRPRCLAASSSGPANETVTTDARSLTFWAAPLDSEGRTLRLRMIAVRDVTAQQRGQARPSGRSHAVAAAPRGRRGLPTPRCRRFTRI